MNDDLDPREDDLDAAAEHALGVTDAEARRAAETRATTDARFRTDLRAWEDRLAPLSDGVTPVQPSPALWSRIEASTSATPIGEARQARAARASALNSVGFWRAASGGLGLAAAACLAFAVVVANRPAPIPPGVTPAVAAPPPMMTAMLNTPSGEHVFVVAYDSMRGQAMVTPMAGHPAPSGRVHELWMIPQGGSPRAVGLISGSAPATVPMPSDLASVSGPITLAVTVEPAGGSPSGQPTSTPIAAGSLQTA